MTPLPSVQPPRPRRPKEFRIDEEVGAITFTMPEPPSANRWWRRSGTHMHLSNEARVFKAHVALLMTNRHRIADGPVVVEASWYRGRKSGDLDKRLGVVLDALQGVAYANDGQIVELSACRFEDKSNPRIVVTVRRALTPEK